MSTTRSRRPLVFLTLSLAAWLAVERAALAPARAEDTAPGKERVVKIVARKFEFSPRRIVLKKDVPVVLELSSADRDHGFSAPALGASAAIKPGQTTRVRLVATTVGTFPFH
jgi:cytochrome c oxidase subunit 2